MQIIKISPIKNMDTCIQDIIFNLGCLNYN